MCEEGFNSWEKLPSSLMDTTQYLVKGLMRNHSYKFRVRAENLLGHSEAAELSHAVLAKDPYGMMITMFATMENEIL